MSKFVESGTTSNSFTKVRSKSIISQFIYSPLLYMTRTNSRKLELFELLGGQGREVEPDRSTIACSDKRRIVSLAREKQVAGAFPEQQMLRM